MMRRWIGLLACLTLATLATPVPAKPRSAAEAPSLSARRAEDLMVQARRARTEGRVVEALESYGRVYRLSASRAEAAVSDALSLLDALRLEMISGDRQSGSPTTPPRAALLARAIVREADGRSIPAIGLPVVAKWSAGAGELSIEKSSDANGVVTVQVLKLPEEAGVRLEVGVDAAELPFVDAATGDHAALLHDAVDALSRRTLPFEFVRADQLKKSRILVLIEENVFDIPARESIVADQLTTSLVDQGLRVVGTTEIGKSHLDKIHQSLDRKEWNALRGELLQVVDFVIYGRIEVRKDYVNDGGGKWSVARGRVGMYGVYSPEILASVDYSDIAVLRGDTWENGAEECLRRCAERTRLKLMPLVIRAASAPAPAR